jgi:hypothetical protein
MSVRRTWRWALHDLSQGLAAHDPSKLMIAPILFVGIIAVLDRAVHETQLELVPGTQERFTRL